MEYVERTIEAGAYKSLKDLKAKLLEAPVFGVREVEILRRLGEEDYFLGQPPNFQEIYDKIILQHAKPISLDLKTCKELLSEFNSLDDIIAHDNEIISNSCSYENTPLLSNPKGILHTKKKIFYTFPREGLAQSSCIVLRTDVALQTENIIDNDDMFRSLYLGIKIQGKLAGSDKLVNDILAYTKQNNLLAINNAALDEATGKQTYFSENLKTFAAAEVINKIVSNLRGWIHKEMPPEMVAENKGKFSEKEEKEILSRFLGASLPFEIR